MKKDRNIPHGSRMVSYDDQIWQEDPYGKNGPEALL